MFELRVKDVLEAVKRGGLKGDGSILVRGVSTDSRTIKRGELFFAIAGPNFNGNNFVGDAFNKGAAAAVVSRTFAQDTETLGLMPIISVDDTTAALGELAKFWREKHPVLLIAISGTCGKTTTKDMTAAILNESCSVLKTEGNLNNHIGLPLTLFRMNNIHNAAVVELGISKKGEMTKLCSICKPDICLLTNIGPAHLKTLENIEGVASAKGELFSSLKGDGTAIINIDDPWIFKIAEGVQQKKITFSIRKKADVCLRHSSENSGKISAWFNVFGSNIEVEINALGMHNLSNAAGAIAASIAAGAETEDIVQGLKKFTPPDGRMKLVSLAHGITLIDDTYNANPLSAEASLKTICTINRRRIAVVGDMLELGSTAEENHRYIGTIAGRLGIDILFASGMFGRFTADGALEGGMHHENVYFIESKKKLLDLLTKIIRAGDTILVKGSRAAGMEEIVNRLKSDFSLQP